jgi:hypothetical protein
MQRRFALKLNQTNLLLVSSLLFSGFAWAERNPDEQAIVEETIEAIDLCMHWGGEEPYSEERTKQIEEGIDRDCAEARQKASMAHGLFPENKILSERVLLLQDFGYFALTDEEKERLCKELASLFEKQFEKTKDEDPFVRFQCPNQARNIYGR